MWRRSAVLALLLWNAAGLAGAATLAPNPPLCHATTSAVVPPATGFHCSGEPTGYQRGTLWLRAGLGAADPVRNDAVLLVHQTRFDRLIIMFHYADGRLDRQEIRRGAYGAHWRIGGQIAFEAPVREAVLTGVTLGFDHLASHHLLRIRILQRDAVNRDLAIAAILTGGSLTLLLAGGIYNLSLAVAVRRQFLAWHGLWAICMVLWGAFWSQAALLAFPAMAGTAASQTCTFLSCVAIALATASVIAALRGILSVPVLRSVALLGISIAVLGIPATLVTGGSIDALGIVLGILVLGDLLAVGACIAWGWRRGSAVARDLAKSWGLPMAILALTQLFDFNNLLFGGGAQIAVLFASALQSIWLSIAATRRLSGMRIELDAARAAESALGELARRDPLTGLLNRRGFVDCLGEFAGGEQTLLALLLIDVDHFKAVNDQFGHETGDAVLCRIAEYFRSLERDSCLSARMGGEEFVLATRGLAPSALAIFAERVRAEVAARDHGQATQHRVVTVSIGVAEGSTKTPFQKLYAAADRALYDAKRSGRNKVIFYSEEGLSREELERDQFAFAWPGNKPA